VHANADIRCKGFGFTAQLADPLGGFGPEEMICSDGEGDGREHGEGLQVELLRFEQTLHRCHLRLEVDLHLLHLPRLCVFGWVGGWG
jgi:hypothetical protein